MKRLLTYYNPNSGAFYSKWVRNSTYHLGSITQYDHIVCSELVYDFYQEKYVSIGNKTIGNFRKNRKGLISRLIDLLYKIEKKSKKR